MVTHHEPENPVEPKTKKHKFKYKHKYKRILTMNQRILWSQPTLPAPENRGMYCQPWRDVSPQKYLQKRGIYKKVPSFLQFFLMFVTGG